MALRWIRNLQKPALKAFFRIDESAGRFSAVPHKTFKMAKKNQIQEVEPEAYPALAELVRRKAALDDAQAAYDSIKDTAEGELMGIDGMKCKILGATLSLRKNGPTYDWDQIPEFAKATGQMYLIKSTQDDIKNFAKEAHQLPPIKSPGSYSLIVKR